MMPNPQQPVSLRGTVDDIIYYNEDNGYVVADVETEDSLVTIVGVLGALEVGEELELTGTFVNHPRHGQQLQVESCVRALPSTVVNIERYLASGIIRGIGRALAKRIVTEFGEFTLDIIEHSPEKLCRIKGISAEKCEEISAAAKQIFGLRNLMAELQQYGIPASAAMRAYRKWDADAWDVIQENPYRLCMVGIDVEFRLAEKLARALHIPLTDVRRVSAGFRWILTENALSGHTCVPLDRFENTALHLLHIDTDSVQAALKFCLEEQYLYLYEHNQVKYLYLAEYYQAEDFIASRISAMLAFSPPEDFDCAKAIEQEEKDTGMTYAERQKQAIACAFSRGLMVLTGGPGTGKTTTLNGVIHLCQHAGSTILLAAPTGRAAKRMTELTGREAKTIHRLLGTTYDENGQLIFQHNEQNPLKADVVIVDEVSMVDTLLFEGLLRALRLSCRVILVGDEDQLPSVGAGNLLHTLTRCEKIPVVRLNEIFRQAQESCIIRSAHQIVSGTLPDLQEKQSDFFFFDRRKADQATELLLSLYAKRLPDAYGFDAKNDIQVISPTRKGLLGTVTLNQILQEAVNPPQYGKMVLKNRLFTFREGDKVMQIQNQYEMEWRKDGEIGAGIFNGDIGIVQSVDKGTRTLKVDFDSKVVTYKEEQLDQLELAYAVTVHKSQGSEFEAVLMMLPEGNDRLTYRSLLYTAVTRAKKLLILIGSPRKVNSMVQNHHRTMRYSCLGAMLEAMTGSSFTDEILEQPMLFGEEP